METDTSGNLTLALSAYDNGEPGGGTSGSPNLACPPLFAWANFMAAGEAIVIYPDHESLTQLSNVQGTTTSADSAVQGSGTAAVPLDQATGYDGSPLISSSGTTPPPPTRRSKTHPSTQVSSMTVRSSASATPCAARKSRTTCRPALWRGTKPPQPGRDASPITVPNRSSYHRPRP